MTTYLAIQKGHRGGTYLYLVRYKDRAGHRVGTKRVLWSWRWSK